ncbi:MAG: HoxN/HupN/NixA family nickel/cobalt transporter [Gammaproteobacteria bacterium]|nr:HoxN/HupN/NixA family nickel/cobalt transporter [Gammaproteobacteria bacterium]
MRPARKVRWPRLLHKPLGVTAALNGLALAGLWDLRALGPVAVGMGLLAYSFGLRHAFDLDHITAIDTVTRALRDRNQRSAAVGLYFSLGHSSVVVLLSLLVATFVRAAPHAMIWLSRTGAVAGTAISSVFLLIMGATNLSILMRLVRPAGGRRARTSPESLQRPCGLLLRFLAALFGLVRRDWQMYFVGLLFGLGFDTATEIAVLGVSAAMAQHGAMSLVQIMVFPFLFTAGMTLLDTLDGLAVARLYDWTVRDPAQRGRLNVMFTGAGVLVALGVSLSEWLPWGGAPGGTGSWKALSGLGFSAAGGAFTALLMTVWLAGWLWHRRDAAALRRSGPVATATGGVIEAADAGHPPAGGKMAMDVDGN